MHECAHVYVCASLSVHLLFIFDFYLSASLNGLHPVANAVGTSFVFPVYSAHRSLCHTFLVTYATDYKSFVLELDWTVTNFTVDLTDALARGFTLFFACTSAYRTHHEVISRPGYEICWDTSALGTLCVRISFTVTLNFA